MEKYPFLKRYGLPEIQNTRIVVQNPSVCTRFLPFPPIPWDLLFPPAVEWVRYSHKGGGDNENSQ
jgi:hypothetical protein